MKRAMLLVAITVFGGFGGLACKPTCNAECQAILKKCAVYCSGGGVTTLGGYDATKSFCADNPSTAGCSNLPH
jgi:hypothetical protein